MILPNLKIRNILPQTAIASIYPDKARFFLKRLLPVPFPSINSLIHTLAEFFAGNSICVFFPKIIVLVNRSYLFKNPCHQRSNDI